MKIIIAGSRSFDKNPKLMSIIADAVLQSRFNITEIVSGGARGVDQAGEYYARIYNIPVKLFIPDWKIGRQAGMIRNAEMADYADGLILLWDGESRGSKGMLDIAKNKGLKIYEHFKYEDTEPVQLSLFGEF